MRGHKTKAPWKTIMKFIVSKRNSVSFFDHVDLVKTNHVFYSRLFLKLLSVTAERVTCAQKCCIQEAKIFLYKLNFNLDLLQSKLNALVVNGYEQ